MAAAGVKSYSFSISWSRIFPLANANTPVNKQAIDHYNDVINTILAFGMQPAVTIQHFDSPYVFFDEEYPETSYAVRASIPKLTWLPWPSRTRRQFIDTYCGEVITDAEATRGQSEQVLCYCNCFLKGCTQTPAAAGVCAARSTILAFTTLHPSHTASCGPRNPSPPSMDSSQAV
jgi:hypothetical protein